MTNAPKTRAELRKFGFVMCVPLLLIGAYLWWKGRGSFPYFVTAAGLFLVTALIAPAALRPVERLWMRFAELISAVMTRVILVVAYYLVITPIGLLLRLLKKDLLDIGTAGGDRDSYWRRVEEDGPATRPDKPY